MSENENQPPAPSKQTSSVPLKKETVRVTLKAADAPPAVPSATVPMAPPVRPPVPTKPMVTSAPPVPTAGGSAPRPPAPAPTIPLRTAGAPSMAPAPTIRLAQAPGAASPTAPMRPSGTGVPTMALPKATVQLQKPTQPLAPAAAASTAVSGVSNEEEETVASDPKVIVLAGLGFAAALVVLVFQLMTANIWINAEDNANKGQWSQLMN